MRGRRSGRPVVAAWLAPLMASGGFALFSGIPVAIVLVRTLRAPRLARLRPLAVATAAAYVVAVALWQLAPDPAESLSMSLHPVTYAVLVATGLAYVVGLHVVTRRGRSLS